MSVMVSRPLLRWIVPTGVLLAVLGGGAAVSAITASASSTLPPRTPAQLLVDLQNARLDGVSGTVVERADLGLPSLPTGVGGQGSASLDSLVTGSHTLRVWYSGPDKTRVALLGALGESDVVRNGSDVWIWSSEQNTAQHATVSPDTKSGKPLVDPSNLPTTPQQAADELLAALDPSTAVSTSDTVVVAGRSAYDLTLSPKDTSSLISSVNIAIDGQRHIPLRVQVYAKANSGTPAFELGFREINFGRPDNGVFAFTPPAGVKVTEATPPTTPNTQNATKPASAVIGKGWTSVLVTRMPSSAALTGGDGTTTGRRGSVSPQSFLTALPTVTGTWGSGKLLSGTLFSALITDDGRVLIGAVSPARLLTAAADPAAALK